MRFWASARYCESATLPLSMRMVTCLRPFSWAMVFSPDCRRMCASRLSGTCAPLDEVSTIWPSFSGLDATSGGTRMVMLWIRSAV